MTAGVSTVHRSHITKQEFAVTFVDLSQPISIARVNQDVGFSIAIPIGDAYFPSATFASPPVIQVERLPFFVAKNALTWAENQPVTDSASLKKCQITFVIEHHQIGEAIPIPIGSDGSSSPLSDEFLCRGIPPVPSRLGRRGRPLDFDRAGGLQTRTGARANVAIPNDSSQIEFTIRSGSWS